MMYELNFVLFNYYLNAYITRVKLLDGKTEIF
jgi:hypothetical protein